MGISHVFVELIDKFLTGGYDRVYKEREAKCSKDDTGRRQADDHCAWNCQDKLEELNEIARKYGGNGENFKRQTFTGYIDAIWRECIKHSDKQVLTAQRRGK